MLVSSSNKNAPLKDIVWKQKTLFLHILCFEKIQASVLVVCFGEKCFLIFQCLF